MMSRSSSSDSSKGTVDVRGNTVEVEVEQQNACTDATAVDAPTAPLDPDVASFVVAALEKLPPDDIKALFPSDYNPFYAGFGNRDTDELSYKKIGIPKGKIFIINPKEDYNSWNYWKKPLPDVDL
ncbi:hypothetical protein GUJ93_ZPchr0079g2774 [Zizania palustris]|uniref:LNS2/PITP domain-containing protein n=1 Tax=Zizania palustris TaxID=103762 RepID=A0A8J5R8Y2_ZIZPA|nr:hypothetical protein GUJ93_ZPchr0079g2774 [Zizania palustris]